MFYKIKSLVVLLRIILNFIFDYLGPPFASKMIFYLEIVGIVSMFISNQFIKFD